jgi:hypothetical protein
MQTSPSYVVGTLLIEWFLSGREIFMKVIKVTM